VLLIILGVCFIGFEGSFLIADRLDEMEYLEKEVKTEKRLYYCNVFGYPSFSSGRLICIFEQK
jgi:hypothetical protein